MEIKRSQKYRAERFASNPIIYPDMPGLEGDRGNNINGPSLICVPAWIEQPLGRYYLYFAHHGGEYIRLAYADALEGPWTVYEPGVLHMDEGPGTRHIASPDVHVDAERREIRMYFHQPPPLHLKGEGQLSFVALSQDGLHFAARDEVLGAFYFRVFQYGGWHYAFGKIGSESGAFYRSVDGLTNFVEGPRILPEVRHTAMWLEGDGLYLLYTLVGDTPERILLTTIDLRRDWGEWEATPAEVVLEPETEWEGAHLPLEPSRSGAVRGPARQLRDPGIFEQDGRRYLLYSVAGEYGIAIAHLEEW